MAALRVRNISAEMHRALRVMAATQGRSTEAQVRIILESAVRPEGRIKLGSLLTEIGRAVGGVEFEITRNKTPAELMSFE